MQDTEATPIALAGGFCCWLTTVIIIMVISFIQLVIWQTEDPGPAPCPAHFDTHHPCLDCQSPVATLLALQAATLMVYSTGWMSAMFICRLPMASPAVFATLPGIFSTLIVVIVLAVSSYTAILMRHADAWGSLSVSIWDCSSAHLIGISFGFVAAAPAILMTTLAIINQLLQNSFGYAISLLICALSCGLFVGYLFLIIYSLPMFSPQEY